MIDASVFAVIKLAIIINQMSDYPHPDILAPNLEK